MKITAGLLASTLGMLTVMAFAGPHAAAQCGGAAKSVSFLMPHAAVAGASFKLAGASGSQFGNRWGDERDEDGMEPIVGLWHVDLEDASKGYSDKGYATWHSDHTEFFNSTRAPGMGAVCQGVWEKVGRSTYQLNHFALGYNGTVVLDPKTGTTASNETAPAQIINIKETVTVDPSRKHFHGVFSVDIYSYVGHALLVSFQGPITADRVTVESPISSQ
jgi:hypothetical protein